MTETRPTSTRRRRHRPAIGLSLALLAIALFAAPAAGAAETCQARAGSATDDEGRTFTTLY